MTVRLLFALAVCAASPAMAQDQLREGGKLPLTNGVASIEGASGGGLATWALIAGREAENGLGGSAHVTQMELTDFGWTSYGLAFGAFDRLEVGYAHQRLDTRSAGLALGLGRGFALDQDIVSAKLRVAGDAVYGAALMPQIAVGAQWKRSGDPALVRALGAAATSGLDLTVSATKLLMAPGVLVSATARWAKANQGGLLGFGSAGSGRSLQFEGSVGKLLTRRWMVGAELRTKPDNLAFARERAAVDLFSAWAATPALTLTAATVDLGPIATLAGQRGALLSLQAAF